MPSPPLGHGRIFRPLTFYNAPHLIAQPGLYDRLYAYYKLDEASGDAVDSAGARRDLPNNGNAIGTTTGKINSARNWNSGGSAYFTGTDASWFAIGANHFSFSLWVNLTNTTQGGGDTGILSKTTTSAPNREWILWHKSTTNQWNFYVSNDGTAVAQVTWPASPSPSTWYHITGGWDGTNVWMSVNSSARQNAAFAGPAHIDTNNFLIGLELGSGSPFSGQIDECAFWLGRDINDYEISQLYNNGVGLDHSLFGGVASSGARSVFCTTSDSIIFGDVPTRGGVAGYSWTQRSTEDFFPCTSGQGNSGANITVCSVNWVNQGAGIYVCNGGANGAGNIATGGTNHALYYYNVSHLATQYAQVTMSVLPTGNCQIGVAVRVQASGENAYYLTYASGGTLILGKVNAGTTATIVSTSKSYSAGNKLRLEVTGTGSNTRLTAYEDTGSGWVAVWTDQDPGGTYIDGGKPGIWGAGATPTTGTVDDWSSGDSPPPSGSLDLFNRSAADASTFGDSPVGSGSFFKTSSDSSAFADAATQMISSGGGSVSASASDAFTGSDAVTRIGAFLRSITDSSTIIGTPARTFSGSRAAIDSASVGQVATRSFVGTRSVSDSAASAQAATRTFSGGRSASDSGTFSDVVTRVVQLFRSLADASSFADVATAVKSGGGAIFRTAADVMASSDLVTRIVALTRGTSDSMAAAQAGSRTFYGARTSTDSATAAGVAARALARFRSAVDAVATSTIATKVASFFRSVIDAITSADVAAVGDAGPAVIAGQIAGSTVQIPKAEGNLKIATTQSQLTIERTE